MSQTNAWKSLARAIGFTVSETDSRAGWEQQRSAVSEKLRGVSAADLAPADQEPVAAAPAPAPPGDDATAGDDNEMGD